MSTVGSEVVTSSSSAASGPYFSFCGIRSTLTSKLVASGLCRLLSGFPLFSEAIQVAYSNPERLSRTPRGAQVWHRTPAQELKEAERHALLAAQRAGLLHGRASYLLETTGLSGLLAATTDILSGRAVSPCGAPGGQRRCILQKLASL